MKDKYILEIEKKTGSDNKLRYIFYKNDVCIAKGKATHDNILELFYEKYPCIIKYVEDIEHL